MSAILYRFRPPDVKFYIMQSSMAYLDALHVQAAGQVCNPQEDSKLL